MASLDLPRGACTSPKLVNALPCKELRVRLAMHMPDGYAYESWWAGTVKARRLRGGALRLEDLGTHDAADVTVLEWGVDPQDVLDPPRIVVHLLSTGGR